jgi:hypothetical protein
MDLWMNINVESTNGNGIVLLGLDQNCKQACQIKEGIHSCRPFICHLEVVGKIWGKLARNVCPKIASWGDNSFTLCKKGGQ